MASWVPGPPRPSSPSISLLMESMISNTTTFDLRGICLIVACCSGIILCAVSLFLKLMDAPVLICSLIILAFILLIFPYGDLVANVQYCFRNIMVHDHRAQTQYDIGSGPLMMTTIRTISPPGRLVINVNVGTATTSSAQTTQQQPPQQECYIRFSYRMDKKRELLCSDDQCVVCLETFKEQDECAMLKCRHAYHPECIDMWLAIAAKKLCPICRQDV